jgi:hypothetical protein
VDLALSAVRSHANYAAKVATTEVTLEQRT